MTKHTPILTTIAVLVLIGCVVADVAWIGPGPEPTYAESSNPGGLLILVMIIGTFLFCILFAAYYLLKPLYFSTAQRNTEENAGNNVSSSPDPDINN